MQERKHFIQKLLDGFHHGGSGMIGAAVMFLLALLLILFGFWKTLFLIVAALVGYYLGVRYFNSREDFKALLDKLFPPGLFR